MNSMMFKAKDLKLKEQKDFMFKAKDFIFVAEGRPSPKVDS